MISDNRLALIGDLITDNLNDGVGSNKVWTYNGFLPVCWSRGCEC